MEDLEVDGADPELVAQVTDERVAVARRQRALEGQRWRSAGIRSLPTPCDIEGRTVWVDPAVTTILNNSGAAWCAPKSLRIVDRRELAAVFVVKDAAQPGGQNQVVAYLRGCLVTTPEYYLAPPGSVFKWKAALLVPRLVYLSDAVCAARACIVDLIHATSRSRQLTNS